MSAGLYSLRLEPILTLAFHRRYWIVDIQPGEPYVAGGWQYLVSVLAILKKYSIQALIDLHGAPGSQVCALKFLTLALLSYQKSPLLV